MTPSMIDLSIEGITGIGAGSCSTGPNVGEAICNGSGQGASSSCSFMGISVNSPCTSGGLPFEDGSICRITGLSAAACNTDGNTATEGMSRCYQGASAAHSADGLCCHLNGSSDSNVCYSGDSNIPNPPMS